MKKDLHITQHLVMSLLGWYVLGLLQEKDPKKNHQLSCISVFSAETDLLLLTFDLWAAHQNTDP